MKTENTKMEKRPHFAHVALLVAVAGILFIVGCILYQWHYYTKPKECDLSTVPVANTTSFEYSFDDLSSSSTLGEYIAVDGWLLRPGVDSNYFNTRLVVYRDSLAEALVFRLAMTTRSDVTEKFDDGHNYDASGFSATIKSKRLGAGIYHVAILIGDIDGNEQILLTGQTIEQEGA